MIQVMNKKIFFIIIIYFFCAGSALFSQQKILVRDFKNFQSPVDKNLEKKITNIIVNQLNKNGFKAVAETDKSKPIKPSNFNFTITGYYQRQKKTKNLNLYCQIVNNKKGYIVNAIRILNKYAELEELDIESSTVRIDDDEIINPLTVGLVIRLKANPEGEVKWDSLYENLINTQLFKEHTFSIPEQKKGKRHQTVFKLLEEQTIITATRSPISLKEAPAAVYVITKEQIKARGYRTLIDALHDVPGFDIIHVYGIFPDLVHQRGLVGNNQRTLLYIDGIPDNNISEGAILGGSLRYPLFNVDRIEIVAGSSSALYGANAFNGVINIITAGNQKKIKNDIQLTVGSHEESTGFMGTAINFWSAGQIAPKSYYNVNGYFLGNQGPNFRNVQNINNKNIGYWWSKYYDNSVEEHYNVLAKLHIHNLRVETVMWQYLQGHGTFANGTARIDTTDKEFVGTRWDFQNTSARIGYTNNFGSKFTLDTDILFRQTEILSSAHESYPNTPGPGAYNRPKDVTISGNFSRPDYQYEFKEKLQYKYSDKAITDLGAEINHNVVPAGYGDYNRYSYKNLGFFLQQVYRPWNPLIFTGGYRFDYNTNYDEVHTPRLGTVWNITRTIHYKFLIGSGFRAPTAWELYNATPHRLKNPNLKPEKLISLESGIGFRYKKLSYLNLTAYYNSITDLILEVPTKKKNPNSPGDYWNQNKNVGDAEVIGAEIQNDLDITNYLNVYWNYTFYAYGEYSNIPENLADRPTVKGSNEIPNIAPHSVNFGITYLFLKDYSAHVRFNYVHTRNTISTNPTRKVDGYFLLHLNFRVDNFLTDDFYLQLLIRNILNSDVFDPGIRTATGINYPTQHPIEGRSIWLSGGMVF
jgi:iron complex outermembrane receptor protein